METRIWIQAVTETLLLLEILVFLIGCQESRWEDLLLGQADPNSSDFELKYKSLDRPLLNLRQSIILGK